MKSQQTRLISQLICCYRWWWIEHHKNRLGNVRRLWYSMYNYNKCTKCIEQTNVDDGRERKKESNIVNNNSHCMLLHHPRYAMSWCCADVAAAAVVYERTPQATEQKRYSCKLLIRMQCVLSVCLRCLAALRFLWMRIKSFSWYLAFAHWTWSFSCVLG